VERKDGKPALVLATNAWKRHHIIAERLQSALGQIELVLQMAESKT